MMLFTTRKVWNRLMCYARVGSAGLKEQEPALAELVRCYVIQARSQNSTRNVTLIAELTLKRAYDDGLINPADLTERGEAALDRITRSMEPWRNKTTSKNHCL